MSKYRTGEYPLVAIQTFIEATRDSGYKSTAAALSELVDNSFEAEASTVSVCLSEDADGKCITVTDDGTGMSPQTMQLALQFGGSTRFNSRLGTGRYGMGLPNGSLSQARRVDVYSWTDPGKIWASYLDVDEIASGGLSSVPAPSRFKPDAADDAPSSPTGTVVALTKCDRLDFRTQKTQAKYLHLEFGRTFRHQLYSGKKLLINGERVKPIDPLFLRNGNNLTGAEPYGPTLRYDVASPGGEGFANLGQIRRAACRTVVLSFQRGEERTRNLEGGRRLCGARRPRDRLRVVLHGLQEEGELRRLVALRNLLLA